MLTNMFVRTSTYNNIMIIVLVLLAALGTTFTIFLLAALFVTVCVMIVKKSKSRGILHNHVLTTVLQNNY